MPEPSENGNAVDYALQKLNEAAQCIAQVEQGNRRQPRASRLSPIRDISADIQRHSTPLPRIKEDKQDKREVFESHPSNDAVGSAVSSFAQDGSKEVDLGKRIPDLWPWLQQDSDPDESESDSWSDRTDPLMAR
ncbi:MAG TPA: hypothetical protein VIY29_23580, partial [Ktedonobacteraceae bacterium]